MPSECKAFASSISKSFIHRRPRMHSGTPTWIMVYRICSRWFFLSFGFYVINSSQSRSLSTFGSRAGSYSFETCPSFWRYRIDKVKCFAVSYLERAIISSVELLGCLSSSSLADSPSSSSWPSRPSCGRITTGTDALGYISAFFCLGLSRDLRKIFFGVSVLISSSAS